MDISKADIVASKAGRDQGQFFFVLDTDGEYVYIADGKGRRVEQPKRKNASMSRRSLRQTHESPRRFATATRYSTANYEGNWPHMVKNSTVKTKGVN